MRTSEGGIFPPGRPSQGEGSGPPPQGFDSPGSIIPRCPRCGAATVRLATKRWSDRLWAVCLLRRFRCLSCSRAFLGFLWQRPAK